VKKKCPFVTALSKPRFWRTPRVCGEFGKNAAGTAGDSNCGNQCSDHEPQASTRLHIVVLPSSSGIMRPESSRPDNAPAAGWRGGVANGDAEAQPL
jgi:hypothetical protein